MLQRMPPIDRVMFVVDPTQPNFLRKVEIHDEKGRWLGSGEIECIHMVRGGLKIDSDHQNADFWDKNNGWQGFKFIKVVIHNGDEPPLKLTNARLQQMERRLYFDAPTGGQLTLYYGDELLEQPSYDYAKLFQPDKGAAAARLGPETPNTAYTGRPDDRSWPERHPVVLWIAIIAAMAVLGGVAFRFLRTATATTRSFIFEKLPLLLRAAVVSVPLAVGTEVLLLLLGVPTPGVILGDLLFPGQPRAAPVVRFRGSSSHDHYRQHLLVYCPNHGTARDCSMEENQGHSEIGLQGACRSRFRPARRGYGGAAATAGEKGGNPRSHYFLPAVSRPIPPLRV